jgi:hypothetical protein
MYNYISFKNQYSFSLFGCKIQRKIKSLVADSVKWTMSQNGGRDEAMEY